MNRTAKDEHFRLLIVFPSLIEKKQVEAMLKATDLKNQRIDLNYFICGAGSPSCILNLSKHFQQHEYNLVALAGIAGAFKGQAEMAKVYKISSDYFGDLGAEDQGSFIHLSELKLNADNEKFYYPDFYYHQQVLNQIQEKTSVTLNKAHGQMESIDKFIAHNNVAIESMEGAAFFMTCNAYNQKCIQIRSVSNYVETRNKKNWEIEKALSALSVCLTQLISDINSITEE